MPPYLPLFEFPTCVVLVDDNHDYLQDMAAFLLAHGILSLAFSNPLEALAYLRKRSYCKFMEAHLQLEKGCESFGKVININLASLYKEINNPLRFNEITVVMVDYSMPEISGEEFCKQISGLPIQKLLLTSEISYQAAVNLFNSGSIHSFMRKEEPFQETIKQVSKLQNRYFQNITKGLLFSLKDSSDTCLFAEEKLIEFFIEICKKYNFIEYYAIDKQGSYLLADDTGLCKLLIINSEEAIKARHQFEPGQKSKKVAWMPPSRSEVLLSGDSQFYDANRIEGTRYCYALINADTCFNSHFLDQIMGYNKHVASH